jgi:hypothetical protein
MSLFELVLQFANIYDKVSISGPVAYVHMAALSYYGFRAFNYWSEFVMTNSQNIEYPDIFLLNDLCRLFFSLNLWSVSLERHEISHALKIRARNLR